MSGGVQPSGLSVLPSSRLTTIRPVRTTFRHSGRFQGNSISHVGAVDLIGDRLTVDAELEAGAFDDVVDVGKGIDGERQVDLDGCIRR